jgi:hypothetical protein
MMSAILLIARNTLRAILSRSALYVWGFGTLLMFLRAGQAIFMKSDNEALVRMMRVNAIGGAMEMWAFGCILAAMALGGTMVAGDMTTRRAVTVLSRPLHRWQFLVGKVVGVWAFIALTLPIGILVALGVGRYLNVEVNTAVLPFAIAQTLVATALFASVSAVVGAYGSAVAGFAICLMLVVVPGYVRAMHEEPEPGVTGPAEPPDPTVAVIGRGLDALLPELYRPHYAAVAWAPMPARPRRDGRPAPPPPQRPTVDAADERVMLAGNVGYAGVYLLLGCLAFSRRDLSLH